MEAKPVYTDSIADAATLSEKEPISYRFRITRESLGVSLRWLSKRTGIPRKKLQQMESGITPFSPAAKAQLATVMQEFLWLEDYE